MAEDPYASYAPGGTNFSGPTPQYQGGGVNWGNVGGGALGGAAAGTAIFPGIGTAIGAGVGAIASIYSSKKQSQAATSSTDAATKAAAAQAAAAEQTLQFQRQQAEYTANATNATNQANYGQYAAKANRLNSVADILGLPNTKIPDFVPLPDPHLDQPPPQTAVPGAPVMPSQVAPHANQGPAGAYTPAQLAMQQQSEAGGAAIQAQLNNKMAAFGNLSDPTNWMNLVYNPGQLRLWVQQGLGPKADDQLIDYYVGKIQGQPGANPTEQAGSANYWLGKLQSDPKITGQGASTIGTQPAQPVAPRPASVAQYLAQSPSPYTTPAVPIPFTKPASIAQYLGA